MNIRHFMVIFLDSFLKITKKMSATIFLATFFLDVSALLSLWYYKSQQATLSKTAKEESRAKTSAQGCQLKHYRLLLPLRRLCYHFMATLTQFWRVIKEASQVMVQLRPQNEILKFWNKQLFFVCHVSKYGCPKRPFVICERKAIALFVLCGLAEDKRPQKNGLPCKMSKNPKILSRYHTFLRNSTLLSGEKSELKLQLCVLSQWISVTSDWDGRLFLESFGMFSMNKNFSGIFEKFVTFLSMKCNIFAIKLSSQKFFLQMFEKSFLLKWRQS